MITNKTGHFISGLLQLKADSPVCNFRTLETLLWLTLGSPLDFALELRGHEFFVLPFACLILNGLVVRIAVNGGHQKVNFCRHQLAILPLDRFAVVCHLSHLGWW